MLLFPQLIVMLGLSFGQQAPLDLTNGNALRNAADMAAKNLMTYYSPNPWGAIPQNGGDDPSSIQWLGIAWEAVLRVAQVTGDASNVLTVSRALVNASFYESASFLGPAEYQRFSAAVLGKWNDDIGWWGMGAMTGAELFSPSTLMPLGQSYFTLAASTYDSMLQDWDPNTCGGGIFWTRDRQSANVNQANYKSTITNAQMLSFAGRLYLLSGNRTFIQEGAKIWKWLRDIGLATTDGKIWDGANAPNCDDIPVGAYVDSYLYGQVVEGLGYMYLATNDSMYRMEAERYIISGLATYSRFGVIRDECEPSCPPNRVAPKGILVRGIGAAYAVVSEETKSLIRSYIENSMNGLVKTCNQQWACGNNWGVEAGVYSDYHTQLVAVEMLYAAVAIFHPPKEPIKFSFQGNTVVKTQPNALSTKSGAKKQWIPLMIYISMLFIQ